MGAVLEGEDDDDDDFDDYYNFDYYDDDSSLGREPEMEGRGRSRRVCR